MSTEKVRFPSNFYESGDRRIQSFLLRSPGLVPTAPTYRHHFNNGWLQDTDLYIGEIAVNPYDNKVYSRGYSGIFDITNSTVIPPSLPISSVTYTASTVSEDLFFDTTDADIDVTLLSTCSNGVIKRIFKADDSVNHLRIHATTPDLIEGVYTLLDIGKARGNVSLYYHNCQWYILSLRN